MKSRYRFNAAERSVLVTPYEYVLEARPGALRLIQPSGAIHAIHLLLLVAIIFGYLGLFLFFVTSSAYQTARPWENPLLLWIILGSLFAGFFVFLFLTEKLASALAESGALKFAARVEPVILRGIRGGSLFQKVLLQTADNRILALEVESTEPHFLKALELAKATLPAVPMSEEEFASMESARRASIESTPGPVGSGRINLPGLTFVVFLAALLMLYIWFVTRGEVVLGVLGLAIFVPLTLYLAYALARTRRFHCGVCGHLTVFRQSRSSLTCTRCGSSWPRESTESQEYRSG